MGLQSELLSDERFDPHLDHLPFQGVNKQPSKDWMNRGFTAGRSPPTCCIQNPSTAITLFGEEPENGSSFTCGVPIPMTTLEPRFWRPFFLLNKVQNIPKLPNIWDYAVRVYASVGHPNESACTGFRTKLKKSADLGGSRSSDYKPVAKAPMNLPCPSSTRNSDSPWKC
jgi:hypothetical protein